MALTAKDVELAGSGKPGALGIGRWPDGDGLYLEVKSATAVSFVSRVTVNGVEKYASAGSRRTTTLKEARERNRENKRLAAQGINPSKREQRREAAVAAAIAAAKAVTFEEQGKRYITAHEVEWKNPIHRQQWKNTLATYVYPIIGKLPLSAIDTAQAMRVFEQSLDGTTFWRARPETAGRVRGRCEQIWASAEAQGIVAGKNPFDLRTLKHLLPAKSKIHQVKHHAAVPWPEIPALMAALRARASLSARALEFTILCASRVNEVTGATGSEFDLANARWKIPGARMKGGRDHVVMLSKRAVAIVRELHPDGLVPDALVFPLTGAAMNKTLRLAGYPDATCHGTARASFKTWADETTAFRDAVSEACLAHIEGDKVKAAYARGEFEQYRVQLMQMWSAHCASSPAEAGDKDKVVMLRGA